MCQHTALDLAKYIVLKCIEDGSPISNLQLQKILYYIQRDFLQKYGIAAFDDSIEAWQFGPVVPTVYYYYCGFGAMTISMPVAMLNDVRSIDSQDASIINSIVEEKRELDPWVMVNETHKPNGAWAQIYKNGEGNRKIIPVESIKAVG